MRARTLFALALCGVTLLTGVPAFAYTQSVSSSGKGLRWPNGTVIKYSLNSAFAPNNNSDLVRAAVRDAVATLMKGLPAAAGIQFQEGTATSVNSSACDGINLVTFTDTADALPEGVIAQARLTFAPSDGLIACGSQSIQATAGQVLDADMLFSTSKAFTTVVVTSGAFDVQAIALHEAGHWLGLNHTGVTSAVMSPFGDTGEFALRVLQTDDLGALLAVYGSTGSSISGVVSFGSATVKGAHVVATDTATGLTTASAVSDQNGAYKIGGLQSGHTYKVFAEPLDGPVKLSNLSDFFKDGNATFATNFLSAPVSVSTGDTGSINFSVSGTNSVNLNELGFVQGNSATFGGLPITMKRGSQQTLVMKGTGLSGSPTFSSSKVTVGEVSTNSGLQLVPVTIAADAAAGGMDVYYGASSFTGGLIVSANPTFDSTAGCPQTKCPLIESAAYNQEVSAPFYASGGMISVFGHDFADIAVGAAGFKQPAALPLPTQLGGVSVKIGNRLAPLFFVGRLDATTAQINAMIPYEVSGTVNVTVVTGNQSESAPISITLSKSAPRIFKLDFNAGGQGAIRDAQTGLIAAVVGFFPSAPNISKPIKRGGFIEIYGHGFGPTTNQPASGVKPPDGTPGSPLAELLTKPTVTVGGKQVDVLFAGLNPFFAGLYQINVQVPTDISAGNAVPVVVKTAEGTANTVTIAVVE